MKRARGLAATVAWIAVSCSEQAPPQTQADARDPQDVSRPDITADFKTAQRAPKQAADGGGRAWLVLPQGESGAVVAGTTGHWTLHYEAGPLGIAEGGTLFLQVSPFFEWSTPQVEDETALGFTRVTTDAEGVELTPQTVDRQLLAIAIRGRALKSGEQVTIEYGAGPAGAQADPYAETNSRFWIAVDGDGDGVRKVLADSPGVDVLPDVAAMLVATLTSTAKPDQGVRLCVALLDARGNLARPCEAKIELEVPEGLELAHEIELAASDRCRKTIDGVARKEGTFRISAKSSAEGRELQTRSNPLLVAAQGPRIVWADLHGHTAVSDGTGSPADYHDFARNVAALDVVALTDHDHWGLVFLDEDPETWKREVALARSFDEPGRFVDLPGFEWTNWITGHRHVLFFGDEAPLLSSMDERYETPELLRAALQGKKALVVPHHPAGGPIGIDWRVAPDPELEPVVEVCSAHGSSEALDCPRVIHSPRPGHFARDALGRGYRFGFVGSGDTHDGHPGLSGLAPHYPTGGLAAILTEDLTRDGVYQALMKRRVYATSGARILVRFALGGARMGEVAKVANLAREGNLFVQVIAQSELSEVQIVLRDEVLTLPCDGQLEYGASATLGDLKAGDWAYLRVLQRDGGMAWSSPIFVE